MTLPFVSLEPGSFGRRQDCFVRFAGLASRLARDAENSPPPPARVRLPYNPVRRSLFHLPPPRSSLPPALHSPRYGWLVVPRPAVCGGGGVIDGPRVACVGSSSSISPAHGCCWSSSSSSSSRRAGATAGCCICLPRLGPMVDAASSSPSHRLLPLWICFLLPKLPASSSSSSPKQGEILKCYLYLA
jgi:hypothetical protein